MLPAASPRLGTAWFLPTSITVRSGRFKMERWSFWQAAIPPWMSTASRWAAITTVQRPSARSSCPGLRLLSWTAGRFPTRKTMPFAIFLTAECRPSTVPPKNRAFPPLAAKWSFAIPQALPPEVTARSTSLTPTKGPYGKSRRTAVLPPLPAAWAFAGATARCMWRRREPTGS